jgi:LacI family transcriptional regulator
MTNKRTSLADIADSLNISKSTVSFVLNGKGKQFNISAKTQQLIVDKANELNYVPNYFAKSLREGKTHTIGLVLADISNPFYSELSKSIQEALYAKGYSLFIVSTNDDPAMELKLMQELILRSVDALIIAPCNEIPALKILLDQTPIPVVWVDRIGDEHADFVGIDNRKEAERIVDLFTNKPKVVAAIIPEGEQSMTIQLRKEGLINSCNKQGIDLRFIEISEDIQQIKAQLHEMKKAHVDGIVALSNRSALNLLRVFHQSTIHLRQDFQFISFDDIPAFEFYKEPVSALRQQIARIGEETVLRLLDRLDVVTDKRKHLLIECDFIARDSH